MTSIFQSLAHRALHQLLLCLALVGVMAVATPLPAWAQDDRPQARSDEPIVVEGIRERERQIGRFVDALTEARVRGQLARFDWKVCPTVAGLPEAQGLAIVERMRSVADAAGIPVADRGCGPNVFIIATSDMPRMMRWLRREAPTLFTDPLGHRVRVPVPNGPAIAWQIEGLLNQDGVPAVVDNISQRYVIEGTHSPSRITPASRPHFLASILVIELESLAGLTTTQVADYSAMRVFARTDPARLGPSSAPSILRLLDSPMGSAVPVTLTHWDLAFLRALYGSAENHYASHQRQEMRRLVRRDLDRARAD